MKWRGINEAVEASLPAQGRAVVVAFLGKTVCPVLHRRRAAPAHPRGWVWVNMDTGQVAFEGRPRPDCWAPVLPTPRPKSVKEVPNVESAV